MIVLNKNESSSGNVSQQLTSIAVVQHAGDVQQQAQNLQQPQAEALAAMRAEHAQQLQSVVDMFAKQLEKRHVSQQYAQDAQPDQRTTNFSASRTTQHGAAAPTDSPIEGGSLVGSEYTNDFEDSQSVRDSMRSPMPSLNVSRPIASSKRSPAASLPDEDVEDAVGSVSWASSAPGMASSLRPTSTQIGEGSHPLDMSDRVPSRGGVSHMVSDPSMSVDMGEVSVSDPIEVRAIVWSLLRRPLA